MRLTPRAFLKFSMPKQGKPMVYPYTWTARWSHWDPVYELRNNYFMRYWFYGLAIMFPVVWYIDSAVNSPAAKAAYKKAKQLDKEREHEAHMWADITGRNAKRGL